MDVVADVTVGVLTSIVYDVGKLVMNDFSIDSNLNEDEQENCKIGINAKIMTSLVEKYQLEKEIFLSLNDFFSTNYFCDIMEKYLLGYYWLNTSDKDLKSNYFSKEDLLQNIYIKYRDFATIPVDEEIFVSLMSDFIKIALECIFNMIPKEQRLNNTIAHYQIYNKLDQIMFILNEMKRSLNKDFKYSIINKNEPTNYEEIYKDYTKLLKNNRKMAHVYLLDNLEFSKFYVVPDLQRVANTDYERHGTVRIVSDYKDDNWKYVFDYTNFIYIIGGPGFGKSLFLNKIINDYNDMNFLNSNDYLVIYGDLKTYRFDENLQIEPILKFLQRCMINETGLDESKITVQMIQFYIDQGRCMILLDALDEVEKEKREILHKKIINYFESVNPNNKICITSRSRGFILDKVHSIYIIESLNMEKIEKYVDNIIKLHKFDKADKVSFMQQTEKLINRNFLNSFLILSLLLNIFKAERELPENKIELYQKCFDYISFKREKQKSSKRYKWDLVSYLMRENTFIELAKQCYPNNHEVEESIIIDTLCDKYSTKYASVVETNQAVEEFLNFCSERTELFVIGTKEKHFKFFHRSFFEYFYSQFIAFRLYTVEEMYNALRAFDVDSEVFELTISILKQKNEDKYQELIKYIFKRVNQENNDSDFMDAFNVLTLCIEVVDDIVFIDEYILLLKDKINLISKNIGSLLNDNIVSIICKNQKYIDDVLKCYEDLSIICIINYVFSIRIPDLTTTDVENIEKLNCIKTLRREIYRLYDMFFIRININNSNSVSSILNLTKEQLIELIDKNQFKYLFKNRLLNKMNNYFNVSQENQNEFKRQIVTYEKRMKRMYAKL